MLIVVPFQGPKTPPCSLKNAILRNQTSVIEIQFGDRLLVSNCVGAAN